MDIDIIRYLVDEMQTIIDAPFFSIVIVLVGFFIGRWYYCREISSLKAEVSLLETTITDMEKKIKDAKPDAIPELKTKETTTLIAETKNDETTIDFLPNNPDLFPTLNETLLKVWATEKVREYNNIKLIQLYISPEAGQKYYIYFETGEFPTKFRGGLFIVFLKKKVFRLKLQEVYRSDLPPNWQDEWTLSTKLADGIDKNYYWTFYKK